MSKSHSVVTVDELRGYVFNDRYGQQCRMYDSSLATEDAIWLGVDEPYHRVQASDARSCGIETSETAGWIDYPIPDKVLVGSVMHLTRDQVSELLPMLEYFVEHGYLPPASMVFPLENEEMCVDNTQVFTAEE